MAARQIPLDLGHMPGQTRDDLILSASNAAAVALVDAWPDWPATTIVLAGAVGSGKSHLSAIWRRRADAASLDPQRLDGAVAGSSAEPILVEDVDRPGLDETGLFHLINHARAAGSNVLLTARTFPATWGVRLSDLASRLRAATVVEIGEPDDMLLAGILAKLFADRQVEVDPSIVDYVVRRMERSAAAAAQVVERMDRMALERKSRITRAIAQETLRQLEAG